MWNGALAVDPAGEILAAWIAKEELRALLSLARGYPTRHEIAHRHHRFFTWCAEFAHIPEIATLAETIDRWWPELLCTIQTGVTNAGTDGINRLVKQVQRSACGFRNVETFEG